MLRFLIDDPGWGGPGTQLPDTSPNWFALGLIVVVIIILVAIIAYQAGKRNKQHDNYK